MLWKIDGQTMKTPSSYKANIEDLDNDSYTSKKTGELIDSVVATGMLKLEMSWDYLTEQEAETLLQATYKNPMMVWVKCPAVKNGVITAPFRVSKRQCEMYKTSQDESVSKDRYKVSFNLMQKAIVGIQNQTVREAQGNV